MKKIFWKLLVMGLVSLLVVSSVYAFTMGSIDATWGLINGSNTGATNQRWATGPSASSTNYDNPTTTTTNANNHETVQNSVTYDWNQVRYGSSSFASGSGFGFLGRQSVGEAPAQDVPFLVGQFCHFNNPVNASTGMDYVPLNINITDLACESPYVLEGEKNLSFQYIFNLDETTNEPSYCSNYGNGDCLCRYSFLGVIPYYRNRCTYGPGSPNWPSDGGTYCYSAGDPWPEGGTVGVSGDLNYNGCADMVNITTSTIEKEFTCAYTEPISGEIIKQKYTVSLLGFTKKPATGGCPGTENQSNLSHNQVYTAEETDNCYCAYAAVTKGQITPVTVQNLDAINVEEGIWISWETVTEINNFGFNIIRAESVDGAQTKVNLELIMSELAPGDAFGASYEFLDETVEVGKTYYYWLIDVPLNSIDLPGVYGPVMVERH